MSSGYHVEYKSDNANRFKNDEDTKYNPIATTTATTATTTPSNGQQYAFGLTCV